MPQGYQLTQRECPIATNASLDYFDTFGRQKQLPIDSIHIESGSARTVSLDDEFDVVDYNHAGLPQLEIVCKSVIENPEDGKLAFRELQELLQALQISSAEQPGSIRCDVVLNVVDQITGLTGGEVTIKNLENVDDLVNSIEFEKSR